MSGTLKATFKTVWGGEEILKKSINVYAAASHPVAEFDKGLLYYIYIRMLIIITKIVDGAGSDILDLLRKEL